VTVQGSPIRPSVDVGIAEDERVPVSASHINPDIAIEVPDPRYVVGIVSPSGVWSQAATGSGLSRSCAAMRSMRVSSP
jgi:hypothetical protein